MNKILKKCVMSVFLSASLILTAHATEPESLESEASKLDYKALAQIVKNGDLVQLKTLADNGADLLAINDRGRSLLYDAAGSGHLDIFLELISRGANVHAVLDNGWSLLHEAAQSGHSCIVRELLVRKVAVNCVNYMDRNLALIWGDIAGASPLHQAVSGGFSEILHLLVGGGADVKHVDNMGNSALHVAAMRRRTAIMSELASLGVDINSVNGKGHTPLTAAMMLGDESSMLELIRLRANVNQKLGRWSITALHLAVKDQRKRIVSILLANGADIDAQDAKSNTPLALAKLSGYTEIEGLLMAEKSRRVRWQARWLSSEYASRNLLQCMPEDVSRYIISKFLPI